MNNRKSKRNIKNIQKTKNSKNTKKYSKKQSKIKNKPEHHRVLYIRLNRTKKGSTKNNNVKTSKSIKKQHGGEFLGSGGFAICVITPPLKCTERPDLAKYMNGKFISKLVEYKESRSSSIEMEIKHGETVVKIDPPGKYFAPVISGCYFTPQKHADVVYKRRNKHLSTELYYSSNDEDEYEKDTTSDMENYYDYVSYSPSNKCTIHKDKIYMNLILRNAGKSIKKVFTSGDTGNLTYGFMKTQFKKIMFHLCHGLMLLHSNHIAHKDIKMDNITIKYNSKGKKARVNFIDFGLSETVYSRDYTDFEYLDLLGGGTLVYTPPDVKILSILIKKLLKHDRKDIADPLGHLKHLVVTDQRIKRFEKNIIAQYSSLGLRKGGIILTNLEQTSSEREQDKFYTESDRNKLYDMLLSDIHKGKLDKDYFGPFGHFYKWDVYSLGLVFTKFVKKNGITDEKCIDLINNMINLNYKIRYNIQDCLSHPYFKDMEETEFVEIYENYPINRELHKKGLHMLENKIKGHHIQ